MSSLGGQTAETVYSIWFIGRKYVVQPNNDEKLDKKMLKQEGQKHKIVNFQENLALELL